MLESLISRVPFDDTQINAFALGQGVHGHRIDHCGFRACVRKAQILNRSRFTPCIFQVL